MVLKYNPLLTVRLDDTKADLSDLEDVNCAGTVNGKVLTYQSGTWIPASVAGGGDMLKAEYVTGAGTVYNASRLEGDVLGTVQAHNVAASKVTSGTFTLARIPSITNAHLAGDITSDKISALSGTAVAYPLDADSVGTAAIKAEGVGDSELAASGLDIAKFTVGTAGAARIPSLPTARITTGTFNANRIPTLPAGRITAGTFGLARIPAMDDARIPNLETLSYGGAFAEGQIPSLPTSKITSGTLGLARIPGTLTGKDADTVDGADAGVVADEVFKIPTGIAQGDTFYVNAGGSVVELSAGTTGHFLKTLGAGTDPVWSSVPGGGDMLKSVYDTGDNGIVDNSERLENNTVGSVQAHNVEAEKVTAGTIVLARIPAMDDAHVPDVDGLSYSGAFATAQIPGVGAYKITSGTLAVARQETLDNLNGTVALGQVPTMDDAHIPDLETLSYGGAFATAQIPAVGAYKVGSGTFNSNRIPILPTDRYGSAVLLTGAQNVGGTKTFTDIPLLPASDPTADNEAARKAYVDAERRSIDGGLYSDTYIDTADIDGGTF